MGVTIHYRGQLADLGKLNILCDELSRVTGDRLERLSPNELASMIEALLQHKFS